MLEGQALLHAACFLNTCLSFDFEPSLSLAFWNLEPPSIASQAETSPSVCEWGGDFEYPGAFWGKYYSRGVEVGRRQKNNGKQSSVTAL